MALWEKESVDLKWIEILADQWMWYFFFQTLLIINQDSQCGHPIPIGLNLIRWADCNKLRFRAISINRTVDTVSLGKPTKWCSSLNESNRDEMVFWGP